MSMRRRPSNENLHSIDARQTDTSSLSNCAGSGDVQIDDFPGPMEEGRESKEKNETKSMLPPETHPLMRLLRFYQSQLKVQPHRTNACVAFMITSTADFLVQQIERYHSPAWQGYAFRRTWALASTSFTYAGGVLTTWLMMLDRTVPQRDMKAVMGKLAASQLFLQPCVYVPFWFFFHGIMAGESVHAIYAEFQDAYFALLFRLWSLFMPTRFIMFAVIPVQYQVLWDCAISFIWQIILTIFAHGRFHNEREGLISEVMDFQGFGYLHPRERGVPFLPRSGFMHAGIR